MLLCCVACCVSFDYCVIALSGWNKEVNLLVTGLVTDAVGNKEPLSTASSIHTAATGFVDFLFSFPRFLETKD